MLDHLFRIHLGNVLDIRSSMLCWGDCPMMDIPETMLAAIKAAEPNIKALTFCPTTSEVDDLIREACRHKGIAVVWARPPEYIRYLDK